MTRTNNGWIACARAKEHDDKQGYKGWKIYFPKNTRWHNFEDNPGMTGDAIVPVLKPYFGFKLLLRNKGERYKYVSEVVILINPAYNFTRARQKTVLEELERHLNNPT